MFECDLTPSRSEAQQRAVDFRRKTAVRAVIDRPINLKNRAPVQPIKIIPIKDHSTDNSHLYSTIKSLEQKMIQAHAEIEKLSACPTYQHTVHKIMNLVSAGEGVSVRHMIGHRRFTRLSHARHICFYLASHVTGRGLSQIGRAMGKKDHTTVLHGARKMAAQRLVDLELDAKLAFYEQQLK